MVHKPIIWNIGENCLSVSGNTGEKGINFYFSD